MDKIDHSKERGNALLSDTYYQTVRANLARDLKIKLNAGSFDKEQIDDILKTIDALYVSMEIVDINSVLISRIALLEHKLNIIKFD